MCYLGDTVVTLAIVINAVNDPPSLNYPYLTEVVFPPVPFNLGDLPSEGVPVAALTKTNNQLLSLLIENSMGAAALQRLASGEDLETLLSSLPGALRRDVQRAEKFKRPLLSDENPEVGMAICLTSRSSRFGKWSYKTKGSWRNLDLNNTEEGIIVGREVEAVFLNPGDRVRFTPRDNSTFWKKSEARDEIFLMFHGWDGSDNTTTGKRVVNISYIADTITESNIPIFMSIDKLGCDNKPGSLAKEDVCGKCNGDRGCVGCDNKPHSGAKFGMSFDIIAFLFQVISFFLACNTFPTAVWIRCSSDLPCNHAICPANNSPLHVTLTRLLAMALTVTFRKSWN